MNCRHLLSCGGKAPLSSETDRRPSGALYSSVGNSEWRQERSRGSQILHIIVSEEARCCLLYFPSLSIYPPMRVGKGTSPGPTTANHWVLFHISAQHLVTETPRPSHPCPAFLPSFFLLLCLPHRYPKLPGWPVTV